MSWNRIKPGCICTETENVLYSLVRSRIRVRMPLWGHAHTFSASEDIIQKRQTYFDTHISIFLFMNL